MDLQTEKISSELQKIADDGGEKSGFGVRKQNITKKTYCLIRNSIILHLCRHETK
jgi:hypothetical protein